MKRFLRIGKIKPAPVIPIIVCNIWMGTSTGFAQQENLDVFHQWAKCSNPGSMR